MSLLKTERLTKVFDGTTALNGVCLRFDRNKVTALIGPNGAGKTTVFNVISGFVRPDSGLVLFEDCDITRFAASKIARLGIGRLFQDVRLFQGMTVEENLLAAIDPEVAEQILPPLFARRKEKETEGARKQHCKEILRSLAILDLKKERAENLSYGQQKLVALARLLAADYSIFLLDEPSAGLAPDTSLDVMHFIRGLASKGRTVALIEHNMNIVLENTDYVYFLDEGRVEREGLPDEVLRDPMVRNSYMGL